MKFLTVCARVPNIYVATSIYTRIWWKNYTQAGKSVFLVIPQKIQYCTMYILYNCAYCTKYSINVLYPFIEHIIFTCEKVGTL